MFHRVVLLVLFCIMLDLPRSPQTPQLTAQHSPASRPGCTRDNSPAGDAGATYAGR